MIPHADQPERALNEVTGSIVNAALHIHRDLGRGLLETVYEAILARESVTCGLHVERQKAISFEYGGESYSEAFRVDLLVERTVVVELKSVEQISHVHAKQLLTYVKLMNAPVGLLINFGGATLKEGLRRVVNSRSGSQRRGLQTMRHALSDGTQSATR
jgi:GxxExxY protein